MASKYLIHSSAKKELTDAVDWYEKERKGKGARFFTSYLKAINAILVNPFIFPKDFDEVRKAQVSKFPYAIFYEAHENEVFIYAVFHHKRNPGAWMGRL